MKNPSLKERNLIKRLLWLGLASLVATTACVKPSNRGKSGVKVTHKAPVVIGKTQASTPERSAAQHLVETGKAAMAQGHDDQAADSFQEAMAVDPSYGVSFLEFAKLQRHLGNSESAADYAEKAASLLKREPDWDGVWRPEIEAFQASLGPASSGLSR